MRDFCAYARLISPIGPTASPRLVLEAFKNMHAGNAQNATHIALAIGPDFPGLRWQRSF